MLSIVTSSDSVYGNGFWKFNNFLAFDSTYVHLIKNHIASFHHDYISVTDHQVKWELLKYSIRKATIEYTKKVAKERRKRKDELEYRLRQLEKNIHVEENLKLFNEARNELESIYEFIAEGIKIQSKCSWYEHGEKSTKYFLNLEKKRGSLNCVKKLIVDGKEIENKSDILKSFKMLKKFVIFIRFYLTKLHSRLLEK